MPELHRINFFFRKSVPDLKFQCWSLRGLYQEPKGLRINKKDEFYNIEAEENFSVDILLKEKSLCVFYSQEVRRL